MKQIILCISFFLSATLSSAQEAWEITADSLVQTAVDQLGTPYKWATSSPGKSFDCSGFTAYVYGTKDITDCRSSKGYGNLGTSVTLEEARKGDCILFTGTQPGSRSIGHVGIVVEHTEEKLTFIHCSSSKKHFGVVLTDYYNSGYPKRFFGIRRLFE